MNRIHDTRKREPAPSWGVLYVLFVVTLGLLWLAGRSALTPFEHKAALLGVMLAFFALTFVWLAVEERRPR